MRANTYNLCNILARLPQTPDTGRPLVLATHYDSVRFGPGAADAGSCVAALLETARALQHGAPLRRPVYLLITDGEEAGLKGAAAFVAQHALALEKPFVVNFDARGTSGPSLIYETHRGNLATVRWMAHCLPRPCFTGSAFVTVYRYAAQRQRFLSVQSRWVDRLELAFIGDAQRYHTDRDTLENLDWRSVQHHGENALAVARDVAGRQDIDLQASDEDAVFCDVLGLFVVYFPESWAWLLAAAACVVLGLCAFWKLRSRTGARTVSLTLLVILVAVGLSAALGWGLARGLTAIGLLPGIHVAHGRWIAALYWPLSLGVLWFGARSILRSTAQPDVWIAFWLVWSIAALVLACWIPGFSYLLLLPALMAAVLSIVPVGAGGQTAALGRRGKCRPVAAGKHVARRIRAGSWCRAVSCMHAGTRSAAPRVGC